MSDHFYEVVAYSRTPTQFGPPTFEFLQRIIALGGAGSGASGGLAWSRELCSDGFIIVSTVPDTIKNTPLAPRLRNLRRNPVELWLYRDGVLVAAGPLIAWQIEGNSLILNARGLLYYLRYMILTFSMVYDGDQALLVKDLIDQHQNSFWPGVPLKTYGDFGIDTFGITSHGVNIEKVYNRTDLINIYDEVYALGEQDNGFDVDYDPTTREIILHHPTRGTDKTETVFLDARGITSPSIAYSLSAKQYATAAVGTGSDEDTTFWFESKNDDLIEDFGLAYTGVYVSGETTQAQVNGTTIAARKLANNPYFVPSKEYYPVKGAELDDFEPGDAVSFVYDTGFGEVTIQQEIKNQAVSVGPDGLEKLNVEFV